MVVIACCIILLIVYIAICCLFSYYFIKHRLIWDSVFSLDTIYNLFRELVMCPEHFIIWIPCIEFEETQCVLDKKKSDMARLQIRKILDTVNKYLIDIECKSNTNINKTKWILEGTMKEFEHMYEESAEFYYKLANSYDKLKNTQTHSNTDTTTKTNESQNESKVSQYSLEDLVIIENNIEICDNIANILSIISDTNYKLLNQIESRYIVALLYDLIEDIRLYKAKCMIEIS